MDTVYIETSIVSHATAWPSSNIQTAAVQRQARDIRLVNGGRLSAQNPTSSPHN